MKKNASSILLLFVVLVLMVAFTGCEKLTVSKLSANYYLKQANGFYAEEKYRAAITAYEKALELNPDLKVAYIYIGTACSQSYRVGKDDVKNTEFAEKGIKYLKLAEEYQPDNETVILALGDLYDKLGKFEEAEQIYRKILEKKADDPKSYYTLASFYSKNGKTEQAEEMFKRRIELNPKDPEGYHYFVGFLQDQRRWADAISAHEKRLFAMLDPEIITVLREMDKLSLDAEDVRKSEELIGKIKANKMVDQAEKDRLIAESQEQVKGKIGGEEAEKKIQELRAGLEGQIKNAEAKVESLSPEEKQKVTECYYAIGQLCWNWSYQTPEAMMAPPERKVIIDKGLSSLEKAIASGPEYSYSYSYMGLLYREMLKVDRLNSQKYLALNEEWNKKFTNVFKKMQMREARKKEIETMGQDQK